MKQEKGITLTSLIIYMILLTFAISMLAVISDMFFSNTKYITESGKYISEFNKFNMYFIEDVKNNNNTYEVTNHQIIFEDGTIYTYYEAPDKLNISLLDIDLKICNNIAYCKFTKTEQKQNNITKNLIQVQMAIKSSKLFEVKNEYVLRYW